jgi:uncharacterized protein YbaA (DUF1428 family)
MARYIDAFVIPIRKKNLKAYKKMAQLGCTVWMDHGAQQYFECVGEDLGETMGLPFPKGLKLKKGETVVFSWILYASKKKRDAVNAKVMKDKRLHAMMVEGQAMPFEMKRMMHGGFEVLVAN